MPDHRSQHFVPQFYLRNFARKGERSIKLCHLATGRFVPTASIRHEACLPYFYGEDGSCEDLLRALEGVHASVIRSIAAEPQRLIDDDEVRYHLLTFLVLQWLRTTARKEELERVVTALTAGSLADANPSLRREFERIRIELDDWSRSVVHAFIILPAVFDLDVKVLHSRVPQVITSDNPVVIQNPYLASRGYMGRGLQSSGVQIICPIDPSRVVIAFDANVYRIGSPGKAEAGLGGKRDLQRLNELQVLNALHRVYLPPECSDSGTEAIRHVAAHRRERSARTTRFVEAVPDALGPPTNTDSQHFKQWIAAGSGPQAGHRQLVMVEHSASHPDHALSSVEIRAEARSHRLDGRPYQPRSERRAGAHERVMRLMSEPLLRGEVSVIDYLATALARMEAAASN